MWMRSRSSRWLRATRRGRRRIVPGAGACNNGERQRRPSLQVLRPCFPSPSQTPLRRGLRKTATAPLPAGPTGRGPLSLSCAVGLLRRGLRRGTARRAWRAEGHPTTTANDGGAQVAALQRQTAPPFCRARACTAPRAIQQQRPTEDGNGAPPCRSFGPAFPPLRTHRSGEGYGRRQRRRRSATRPQVALHERHPIPIARP